MAFRWACPSIKMPFPEFGNSNSDPLAVTSRPAMVSVTCTPVALPPSSMPLPRLPETMQVRIRLLPPLDVIRIPSPLFGAAPPNAKMPPKVLNETNPLAVPRGLDAVAVVARDHVAQRDHAADLRIAWKTPRPAARRRDWPRQWRCWRRLPMKLACTVVLLELVIRRPLPPLPLSTL